MSAAVDYILHLADNALVLGQRNAEWCGHGPILEEDIAQSNVSLDLIGQARMLYQLVATLKGGDATEDKLAYFRDTHEFRNYTLLELPHHGPLSGYASSSLEMDFYGGYKGTISGDLGFDVGLLQYYYPGTKNTAAVPYPAGINKADTLEMYGALTWKWLSAKYSYSLNDQTFGVKDSSGSSYLDFSANFPLTDAVNLVAHYGIQKYEGSGGACGVGVSNDICASYKDWKLGATYALPQSFTIGGYWTGTDMTTAQKTFYTNGASAKMIGKDTFTLFVAKTF